MDLDKLQTEINLLHERICYALGDPKRLMLLYLIHFGPKTVNELTHLMDAPQPTISRHLRVLRERGLVVTHRCGPAVIYSLANPRLIDALDTLREVLNQQLLDQSELTETILKP